LYSADGFSAKFSSEREVLITTERCCGSEKFTALSFEAVDVLIEPCTDKSVEKIEEMQYKISPSKN
jgi:hypothetical protein